MPATARARLRPRASVHADAPEHARLSRRPAGRAGEQPDGRGRGRGDLHGRPRDDRARHARAAQARQGPHRPPRLRRQCAHPPSPAVGAKGYWRAPAAPSLGAGVLRTRLTMRTVMHGVPLCHAWLAPQAVGTGTRWGCLARLLVAQELRSQAAAKTQRARRAMLQALLSQPACSSWSGSRVLTQRWTAPHAASLSTLVTYLKAAAPRVIGDAAAKGTFQVCALPPLAQPAFALAHVDGSSAASAIEPGLRSSRFWCVDCCQSNMCGKNEGSFRAHSSVAPGAAGPAPRAAPLRSHHRLPAGVRARLHRPQAGVMSLTPAQHALLP